MSEASLLNRKEKSSEAETPHFFAPDPASPPGAEALCSLVAGIHLRAGDLCPQCHVGRLDYDGLLNLTCPDCGYSPGGGSFS